jgi:hypothetical protein
MKLYLIKSIFLLETKENRIESTNTESTKTHWIYNKFFVEKGVKEGTMVL